MEKADGGHSLARHGPEVPDKELKERLTLGKTPGEPNKFANAPPASTRFNSDHDWLQTRAAAEDELKKKLKINSLTEPPKAGQDPVQEFVINHGKPIDDGFKGTGTKVKKQTLQNKKVKVHEKTEPIEGLTGTRTTFKWDANNQR